MLMSEAPPLPRHLARNGGSATLATDAAAIAGNVAVFAAIATGELMAVVKADGFGHGAVPVARTALANGATWLGVTSLAEAVTLRNAGIAAPLLSWLNPITADFASAITHRIDVGIPHDQHLYAVAAASRAQVGGDPIRVHLQLDVGMARDGCSPGGWGQLFAHARHLETPAEEGRPLIEVVGIMGHLGCAEEPHDPCTDASLRAFQQGLLEAERAGLRPRWRHLAATAATLTRPDTHFDLCRVGAGIVGLTTVEDARLQPALTLTAPVISTRTVVADTGVGYGHEHRTERSTRLALLGLGYADGIPRRAAGRAEVLVHGRRCRIVGRVSMDQLVVDVSDLVVQPGDIATIFGPGSSGEPTVRDWARWSDTIEHDIVTGIGARVQRKFDHGRRLRALA